MILITEEQTQQMAEALQLAGRRLKVFFDQLTAAMNVWFPYVSEWQRWEARRVHRLYRRKQLARRKRNRKR